MYAVIFKAEIAELDDDYLKTAKRMRELALEQYGCLGFESTSEDGREISISYWSSEAHIARWKNDAEHLQAQKRGRERWYRSYTVEIAEVKRRSGLGRDRP